MTLPRFNAESSIYKSSTKYRSARISGTKLAFSVQAAGPIGCPCHPFASCVPDTRSPTGCMLIGQTCYCAPIETTCTGCNPLKCPSGLTNCSEKCVDLNSDANNCGVCGHVCVDSTCQNGKCFCGPGLFQCGNNCCQIGNEFCQSGQCWQIT